jgi:hypothetical protein
VPIVLKSGGLNLLEPSGPLQACNGIAYLFLMVVIEEHISIAFFQYFFLRTENVMDGKLQIMQVYWLFLCLTAIRIYDHDLIVVICDPNVLNRDRQFPCYHHHACNY